MLEAPKCIIHAGSPGRRASQHTIQTLPDKSVRWDDTVPNLYKGLTNRSHEDVAQTLPGIPRNFLAIIKMNFHETNKQTRRGNSTYCVFFLGLPLTALYGAQVRGGDDGSSFIIHGKIALFITEERGVYSSVRRRAIYVYWQQACCKCKSTCVTSFAFLFCYCSNRVPKIFLFSLE